MGSHKQHSFERKPEKLGSLKREFRICTNVLLTILIKREKPLYSFYRLCKCRTKIDTWKNFQLILKVYSLSKIVLIIKQNNRFWITVRFVKNIKFKHFSSRNSKINCWKLLEIVPNLQIFWTSNRSVKSVKLFFRTIYHLKPVNHTVSPIFHMRKKFQFRNTHKIMRKSPYRENHFMKTRKPIQHFSRFFYRYWRNQATKVLSRLLVKRFSSAAARTLMGELARVSAHPLRVRAFFHSPDTTMKAPQKGVGLVFEKPFFPTKYFSSKI